MPKLALLKRNNGNRKENIDTLILALEKVNIRVEKVHVTATLISAKCYKSTMPQAYESGLVMAHLPHTVCQEVRVKLFLKVGPLSSSFDM